MTEKPTPSDFRVCIVSASGQNVFFAELLDVLAKSLIASDMQVESSVDRFPPWHDDVVYLFVPHEFMPLVDSQAHPSDAHLARSVVLATEQPGTHWFEQTAALADRAAAAVDINPLGVRELSRRGIDAERLQLGYLADWDTWGGEDLADRPVDVIFMGGYTPRRAQVLASCARTLASRRADLIITDSARPHLEDSAHFLSGERRWAALRGAKLLLNLHRGELGYLEWLRVIGAMLNGCVVLTEHSVGFEPLVPGEHFVSVGCERLPAAIRALLSDQQRLHDIRHAAYRFLRERLPLSRTIQPLLETIHRVAKAKLPADLEIPAPVPPTPLPPPFPATEYERIFGHRTDIDRLRAAVKDLVLGQADLRRQITAMGNRSQQPARGDMVVHLGPREREVRVSILLTVYNYAELVAHAIDSVARSEFDRYELVVVDDCSSDDSVVVIHDQLAHYPWLAATVVARRENHGLAAARNCAIEHARGELVFVLDADNQIYPHALGRLVQALDDTPWASFAYGIIEKFGPEGPRDLMSWHHWDPLRLRFGNYIDAMAMIRRHALLETGAYTRDPRLYGWEDFALWCEFAQRDLRGIRVPEILARYRTGVYSMISITDIDGAAAWSALVEKASFLVGWSSATG